MPTFAIAVAVPLVIVFLGTQRMHKIGLTIVTPAVPAEAITRDGVKVSAVVYFRVVDPAEAVATASVGFLGNSHRSGRAHSQSNRRVAFKTRVNLISAHQGDKP